MRLADFIQQNLEPILAEWEVFARGISAGAKMNSLALRDHAQDILLATVRDMNSAQSGAEQSDKARGRGADGPGSIALNGASDLHAVGRLGSGFDLMEVIAEYRALRASVLRLWESSKPDSSDRHAGDVTRFNESIDQSLGKAASSYTKRVDQSRDMFLAILSHDLRNPLNSISMSADLLPRLAEVDSASIGGCAAQITTNANVMNRMISDLLDYTRTRLGAGMPVSPTPMDLSILGRELFNEYHSAHPSRDIRFQSEGDITGEWDADRLRQAISNLLGNAIQHGAEATPIELRLKGHVSEVELIVYNGGPPISPGELAKIFDPAGPRLKQRATQEESPRQHWPGPVYRPRDCPLAWWRDHRRVIRTRGNDLHRPYPASPRRRLRPAHPR